MKKIVSFAVLALWVSFGYAQTQNQKKLLREQRREERRAQEERQDSLQFCQAFQAINDRAFTLEANQVVFKYGQTAFVSSNTNFVSVNGDQAVVQIAFNVPSAGPNGLGGITVQGSVSGYQVTTDNTGNVYVAMNVMGAAISATINITLYSGGNQASVTVNPNFNSNQLTLNGQLVPSSQSTVFQGATF